MAIQKLQDIQRILRRGYNNLKQKVDALTQGLKVMEEIMENTPRFPEPTIDSLSISRFNHSSTKDIIITGSYFTKETTVVVVSQTVNSVTFVNSNQVIVNITSNTIDGLYDLSLTTQFGTAIQEAAVEVKLSTWVDLREGGESFNTGDITFRTGMSMGRDADGMFFNGSTPWQSWVKFNTFSWTRGEEQTLEWIFTRPNSSMMIGIGSDATDETSTAQYAQGEIMAFFTSSTNFWGLYGNNGSIGSAGNQSQGSNISGGSGVYKIKFEMDGSRGGTFTLYELPSADAGDWEDETNIKITMTIGGSLNPDENNIMPFILPRGSSPQRFLGFRIQ